MTFGQSAQVDGVPDAMSRGGEGQERSPGIGLLMTRLISRVGTPASVRDARFVRAVR